MLLVISLPHVWVTYSLLAKETSHMCLYQRARVSGSASLRRETGGWQRRQKCKLKSQYEEENKKHLT
jgi:hypothetical protein